VPDRARALTARAAPRIAREGKTMRVEDIPFSWARREVAYPGRLRRGARGRTVRMVQEWLTCHRFPTAVDGDFGPATELALRDFQRRKALAVTGAVDENTFAALVRPLMQALEPIDANDKGLPALVLAYARRHVALHPVEVGGENAGPWVRLYMQGREGVGWPWCAGFVTFLMKQACAYSAHRMPISGSPSCDSLSAQARSAGRFVSERDARAGALPAAACIFLVRRTPTDWVHTGLVSSFEADAIRTLEGNTNDSGAREGFEAIARARGYAAKDYVSLE
jgi:hypothetical protein